MDVSSQDLLLNKITHIIAVYVKGDNKGNDSGYINCEFNTGRGEPRPVTKEYVLKQEQSVSLNIHFRASHSPNTTPEDFKRKLIEVIEKAKLEATRLQIPSTNGNKTLTTQEIAQLMDDHNLNTLNEFAKPKTKGTYKALYTEPCGQKNKGDTAEQKGKTTRWVMKNPQKSPIPSIIAQQYPTKLIGKNNECLQRKNMSLQINFIVEKEMAIPKTYHGLPIVIANTCKEGETTIGKVIAFCLYGVDILQHLPPENAKHYHKKNQGKDTERDPDNAGQTTAPHIGGLENNTVENNGQSTSPHCNSPPSQAPKKQEPTSPGYTPQTTTHSQF